MKKTELLGSLEQKIMDILWQAGKPLKPMDVLKKLNCDYAYTTVMTVLKRMHDKKMLSRKLEGKVFLYSPTEDRESFVKTNLNGIFGGLVGSYGKLAISQFVDSLKGNENDLKLLRQYLDQNDKS